MGPWGLNLNRPCDYVETYFRMVEEYCSMR